MPGCGMHSKPKLAEKARNNSLLKIKYTTQDIHSWILWRLKTDTHGHSRWTLMDTIDTQDGHSWILWTLKADTHGYFGHSRWTLRMDTQDGHSRWTLKMDAQDGHSRWIPPCLLNFKAIFQPPHLFQPPR